MEAPDPMGRVISTLELRGRPLTTVEIGEATGMTRALAGSVLNQLRRAGVVRPGHPKPDQGRTWRLT